MNQVTDSSASFLQRISYWAVEPEWTTSECDGDVRVIQTPVAFAIELRLSPQGKTSYTVSRRYVPWQAEEIASQIHSGDASKLIEKLGDQQAKTVADDMGRARRVAITESVSETVGEDVVEAYQDEKVSNEEFAHEMEQQIEFEMDRRDEQ